MKYRILGKTGLRVSVIGVGTWQFGGEWGKDFAQPEVDGMFARAAERGINLIDTAECYGDHLSESFIGNAIAAQRREWIVATKFGHKFNGYMDRTEPRRPADITAQLHGSLKALKTDYIDLYQYHSWGDDQFFAEDVQAELEKHVAAGKVLHLGNSAGSNSNLKQIEASTGKGISAIQIIYNRLDRAPEAAAFPACIAQNLGVLARVPLASGFLSGKYKPGATFPKGDVRHTRDHTDMDVKLKEVQEIAQNEVPGRVNMAEWALAWCLKHPAVTCVIPGCKNIEQVESNAAAADMAGDDHPQSA